MGDNTTIATTYYKRMGFSYLDYEDKIVEVGKDGYQIDLNKLKYIYSSINAYNNEQTYSLGDIKYTSLDETKMVVDEAGKITVKDDITGTTKVKIEDITNNYETYFTVIVNRMKNTDNITYIYTIEDLVKFRDSVNTGNNYKGKTVYLMADIDMSEVCSDILGSWTPIGATGTYFAGTFDGNYHTISNLYIKNTENDSYIGLFTINLGKIKNLLMDNVYIYVVYTNTNGVGSNIGGLVASSQGCIENIGMNSGSIYCEQTVSTTNDRILCVGGIVGTVYNSLSKVTGCYNKINITGLTNTNSSNRCNLRQAGIAGYQIAGIVENCYNNGKMTATGSRFYVGGIVGCFHGTSQTLKNSYNSAEVIINGSSSPSKKAGGIVGVNGDISSARGTITNTYCLTTSATYAYYYNGSSTTTLGKVESAILKTYSTTLGKAFENDDFNINSGYPILWWQAPKIELNKKQEYIKVGEQLQLSIIKNEAVTTALGTEISISDFTWTSTNEDIATVNENGLVTGLADGYTTIHGYNGTNNIYTMCIINVAKEIANPQIETGNGFTAILKADGTVWTIGKNENGQLGDGTNEEKIQAVQVKIDKDTYLTDVVKISVGEEHVLALTKEGKIYAWGLNTYGQLGQNNTENSNYAKAVLGEGGSDYLNRIVDISAGSYGSTAINEFGWIYVWGNGTYGEIGNGSTTSSYTPVKNTLNTGISVSMGAGHTTSLGQNGKAYTWGRNTYGELGIGNTTNNTEVSKVAEEVTQISSSGYDTILEKVNGSLYGAGLNTNGQLANGTTVNKTAFTQMSLPSTVITDNKVKYVKAGTNSTTIMLTDGIVWTVGNNVNGTLGNGTNESSTAFVQAKTKEADLENNLMIGRNSGINTAVINQSGRIYTTGSNTYGQIGNNTKDDVNYFTVMGYPYVDYPTEIKLNVGDNLNLTEDNFAYIEKYFNVYKEDIVKESLVDSAKMLDSNIATYENGTVTANNIGNTVLIVKQDETNTLIYIPVRVLPTNGEVVPDVRTSNNYTITLKSDGTVWTFGSNTNGELGLGDNLYKNAPKQVELLKEKIVEQISVGNNHAIVLTQDGEVYTWGLNTNGQLGIGNTKNSNIPQKVEIPESAELVPVVKESIVKVIANKNISYAITQNGKVYAWGEGYGLTPTLLELENKIIDISKNYALDIEGNVYNLETNTRLEIVEKIKYISESDTHTVFLSEAGTAYSIGSNMYGQFGNGTNVSNNESVVAVQNETLTDVLRDIVKVEAGNGYTLALLSDGKILATGINSKGQLGTDELDETNIVRENTYVAKLLTETSENIMLIDAGKEHSSIALTNGNVYTWGSGTNGELGNGTNDDSIEPQLVGKNIVEANTNNLLLNVNDTFELSANTTYFNLIQDIKGEISYESKDETVVKVDSKTGKVQAITQGTTVIVAKEVGTQNICVIQVRVLPEGINIEPQVATNGSHTVTLKVDGTVWCYGNNTNGELGNGTTTYSDEPVQAIFPDGTVIIQVVAGENFSAALDSEGNVWTWGANDYKQLGNSNIDYATTPTKVENLSNITKIAAGTYSVLAINENKEVYGWGLNSNGELGIGSYTNKVANPTKAKYIADVIDISVGKNHSILLKTTGEVYVTGLNIYGQLGNNDTSIKKVDTFTKVEGLTGIARISATDSANIVSTINGKVYTWGLNIYGELGLGDKVNKYEPTLVSDIENIVQVEGGKNHSILLDKNGNVYTSGSNKYGQLGIGINVEKLTFTKIDSLNDVMTISAGNTYTAVAKTDGTVWGFGDYNHGDKELKSKTNSFVPMQVGNDTFGLGINKITIKKSETVNITSSMVYSFNLIYEDKNNTEQITYQSLNEEIAIVNENGEVLGVREGFTWVKAVEEDGTEHVVYVYVTDNEQAYAPAISAGEDFASVLKADGTIWTFGHNNNGELGVGSNKTKDIPEKTNVISSYKDIKSGNSFTIAIRNDGTVWSYGKNNYGQLGIGNTKNGINPAQVSGLSNIVQIATGKEHSVALDDYGILYGWGRNTNGQLGLSDDTVLIPTPISYTAGTISSIWAGENQTIIINTKGEIYGYGSILNGALAGIENAVKVSVGNGNMFILTTNGEIYQYEGTTLTKITTTEKIVDIDVTNDNIIAQTVDEKIYTWTTNSTPVLENLENIYTIAAGANNSYIIKTDGTVYARGINQYGQLGNSTREDSLTEFTLVGDREFSVEPESAIMYVNDVEKLTEEITINEFNVFNKKVRNAGEYTWDSSNTDVVTVANGEATAIAEGTSQITVTDNVTGAEVKITRVVIPVEKDRLDKIKVNDNEATIKEEYRYGVEVETNLNTATLVITTKDTTDKISIDGGTTWFEKGTLTKEIDIPNDENEVSIIVETTNGTQIPYTLIVKKIETDVSLESITVDGITATATSSTNYEVVVPESTTISEIIAKANSSKAKVSINGEGFLTERATANVEHKDSTPIKVPIIVQAENGDELEYTLTVYKESTALQLESLTVNGKEAIKTSEGVYSITIARNLNNVEVTAKAISELVNVSLNSGNAEVKVSTKQVAITDEITEVQIRLSTTVDGVEVYKDYILNIYKKAESGNVEFVIVNGTVITPRTDGTYETYLPAETLKATVKVIAQNETDYVQIETNEKELGSSEVEVQTPNDSNKYTIKIIDDEGNTEEYTLYIKKPSVDATLKQITVSNGTYSVKATKSTEEENVYTAKVKAYNNYTVTATTNNINAYVGIDADTKTKNIATKVITRTDEYMEVLISVTSENGDLEEYTLKIFVMSSDASLEFIKVNNTLATLQADGTYLVNLTTAETNVNVNAQATSSVANVKVDSEEYELHTTTRNVTIDSKDTKTYIYVQAEDGTTKKYTLVISGLPDDATLQKVTVNGIEAKYIEGQNKYEIRLDDTEFNIEAIATDSLAKVSLNGGTSSVGSATTTVTKTGTVTTVTIKVTAQDGVDSSTYTLEIKEKSSDASISSVTVNGKAATKNADGNYEISVVNSVTTATIKVETNDSYATVYLDDNTNNSNNITVTKKITQRETIYTIKVIAEDGTEEEHTLTITRLDGNVNIEELTVTLEVEETTITEDESTGETTEETAIVEKTYIPELKEDGTYYLKIDRVENVNIKAIAENVKSYVKIKNSAYVITQNEVKVDTVSEKTTVIISVKAEDGTIKDYTLVLEKKSNDTKIKTITSTDMIKLDNYTMYVDESLTEINLTLVTNSSLASIKLDSDTDYTPVTITRTIDLSESEKVEDGQVSGWPVNVEVLAEDGTVGNYVITIVKTGNTNISSVKVNDVLIENKNNTYTARVNVASTANVEITAENSNATIEIIKVTKAEDGTQTETVVATGTGTLTTDVALEEEPQNYTIRITSAGGSTTYDYSLVIEQKSTDTSLSYVKVNNITAIETTEGFKSVVSGKDNYPVTIKATDEKAQIKIAYKDYVGNYSKGKLEEIVPVAEGETLEVTVTVQAENGNEETYIIYITRISDNIGLEYVKVNGVTATDFNVSTNTYTIIVDNTLTTGDIEVKTVSDKAKVTIGSNTETQIITTTVSLDGEGTTKTVKVKVEAEDGTTKEYYVKIIQLSASITLDKITVNGLQATKVDEINYEVTISSKDKIAKVVATAVESISNVSIDGNEATLGANTKTFNLNGCETIQTTITITVEDGVTSQNYTLTIYVQDSNTDLEYVKVDGVTVTEFDTNTNTYSITVDNTLTASDVEVKAVSDVAKIIIKEQTEEGIISQNVTLEGPGKTTTITILVTAEDGSTEEYTLNIYQKSNNVELDNITVNGETVVLNEDTGIYEIEITDSVANAKVIATAVAGTSKVSIDGETATLKAATKTISVTGHEIIEMIVTVIAEDGETKDYNLKITVLEDSSEVSYVKVNTGTVTPEEDGITYKTFIDYNSTSADIEIKAESEYANIEITNKDSLSITNETLNAGLLSFTVNTPESVTTINYTVTSETGVSKNYTIVLTKISTDNTLKELYVGEQLVEVSEDGNYYVNLENAQKVIVKAIANNEYASVRIDYNAEEKGQTQATINAEKSSTKVTITITSQSGVTAKYYLFIRVLANNTLLDKVLVDSIEVTDFKEETMTYTAIADNTKDSYEVFLMAVNDQATVELYDGETLLSSGVGSLTDIVSLDSSEEMHSYKVKVSLDETNYTNYTLQIIRTSNDTSLKLVEVNDVVRKPTDADKLVYEVGIPQLAETAKIKVQATNNYAKVRIGDNEEVYSGATVTINLSLLESRTTVPVVVTAVDGTTVDTFNILLIRQSNDADIVSLIVNDTEIENVDDVYTYYMGADEDTANVEISTAEKNSATIEVDDKQGVEYLEFTETFTDTTIKIEKIVKVTSQDGTVVKEYKLVLCKKTQITGTILTENYEGKHVTKVKLYKVGETEPVKQIKTNEDGTYVLDIEEIGTYEVVVEKLGYLKYKVTNIEILPGDIIELGEYNLIAGDVVETGEIEIDDLVALNDNFGVTITDANKDTKSIYDLNEDGTVDKLDRDILKKNYGKKVESIEWVKPSAVNSIMLMRLIEPELNGSGQNSSAQNFILPMTCEYVITSEYGERIHPITGETSFHSGIDIVGEHHTEILAVADGEVTYAGVQSGYGNCVEIKHIVNGETIYSFYAHLSRIDVTVGQTVSKADVIGLEGGASTDPNPGTSTGHHLHFELRSASGSGHSLNPNNYIEF